MNKIPFFSNIFFNLNHIYNPLPNYYYPYPFYNNYSIKISNDINKFLNQDKKNNFIKKSNIILLINNLII